MLLVIVFLLHERTVIYFAIQIQSWIFKTQSKSKHSPKEILNVKSKSKWSPKKLKNADISQQNVALFSMNSVQIRSGS